MITRTLRGAAACALLTTTALMTPATAYAATPAPKYVDTTDDHSVDLVSGLPFFSMEEGGIGSGPGRLAMQRIWSEGAGFLDNWSGGLYRIGTTKRYVSLAGISAVFSGSGSTWTSDKADGATLTIDGSGNWIYTGRDGTKVTFIAAGTTTAASCPGGALKQCQIPISIVRPDGMKFTLAWDHAETCTPETQQCGGLTYEFDRLKKVTSSAGYSFTITYASNVAGSNMTSTAPWFQRTAVTFTNSANVPSPLPAISYAYPSSTVTNVTDPAGRTWVLTTDSSGRLAGIRRPGSALDNITYGYGTDGTVNTSTKDGVTNTYGRSIAGTTATETLTNPLSQHTVVVSDTNSGRPSSFKDGNNHTTSYAYDTNTRLTKITAPEGNYVQYGYDARGNVTTTTNVAKSGSGLSNIVTSAGFDTTCTNIVKCNEPNSTTDAKGNITNYSYDPTHGGVVSVTRPAPTTGAVQPQTRYSYTQITSASGDLVYMLTGISACQTTASCTGNSDETKAALAYNSNLLATSLTRASGDGALSAANTYTYDSHGNVSTVDGPLAGTADTTKYRYDAADQLVGVTSPDPDGAGALKNRAIRVTYRSDGQVSKQELGTVNSQSDADWSLFSPLQTIDVGFDTNNRPITSKLSASGTDYALTQTSYDALGRTDCQAVRMNIAVYGSLPSSACTLSTAGSFGSDRISQNVYDAASQVTQLKEGVGTSDAATERTLAYTNNGQLQTLTDGENNKTTYVYDGFDRLSQTQYPNPTKGAGTSNASDYEQLGYDANGNVTSRRVRDGSSIGFTYDHLDRVTLKDLPGSELDVSYAYDNLDRPTQASQTGNAVSFGWDALSRKTSEAGPQGTTGFGYDPANERTSIIYSTSGGGSALTVNYAYLTTGELSSIQQSGSNLASYNYDNLGNRTNVNFGNGAAQSLSYDPVSRLSQLTNDLSGSTNDLTATFSYNPASQISSAIRTGDPYAWTGHGNGTTSYTQNGRNQQITIGGAPASWDSKGNLTAEPQSGRSYCYSSENLLVSSGGTCGAPTAGLGYDPDKRLYQVAGGTTTRFAYDGLDAIAEYNNSNALQRRYVFDPTTDQPVVQYEGTGTGNPQYLSADERGSVISQTDGSGAVVGALKTYDEYGKPGAGNQGRYQYTGQIWIGEAGVYDYKARDYIPQLGSFSQTDPAGYGDTAHLYAYVGDDPINFADPTGLVANGQPGTFGSICRGGNDCTINGMDGEQYLARLKRVEEGATALGGGWYCFGACGSHPSSGVYDSNGDIPVYGSELFYVPSVSLSDYLSTASLRFTPSSDIHGAEPNWVARFEAIPHAAQILQSNLNLVMSGLEPADRVSLPASQIGLPGGRYVFYDRWSVFGLSNVPGVLNGPRIFYERGSPYIYFAPFHGNPGPGVPSGYIQFHGN